MKLILAVLFSVVLVVVAEDPQDVLDKIANEALPTANQTENSDNGEAPAETENLCEDGYKYLPAYRCKDQEISQKLICCPDSDVLPDSLPNAGPDMENRNLVTNSKCGVRKMEGSYFRKYVNKPSESEFGEFPWTITIFKETIEGGKSSLKYAGGGSLIHPKVVLTSANYLLQNPTLAVRAGEWNLQADDEIMQSQDRKVVNIIIHDQFYKGGFFNNIALLVLETPFELASHIQPICLAKNGVDYDSVKCTATGWGAYEVNGSLNDIMKKIHMPIVPRDRCQEHFRAIRKNPQYKLHDSYLCAGGNKGQDTCVGDRGSPLVCPTIASSNQFVQTGIVSWGLGCELGATPGMYTNVASLREWIDNEMKNLKLDTSFYDL